MMKLSGRVSNLLNRLGHRQVWLCKRSGISTSVLSRLLNGTRPFTASHILAIAPIFALSAKDLVDGTDCESLIVDGAEFSVRGSEHEAVRRKLLDCQQLVEELEQLYQQSQTALSAERDQRLRLIERLREAISL